MYLTKCCCRVLVQRKLRAFFLLISSCHHPIGCPLYIYKGVSGRKEFPSSDFFQHFVYSVSVIKMPRAFRRPPHRPVETINETQAILFSILGLANLGGFVYVSLVTSTWIKKGSVDLWAGWPFDMFPKTYATRCDVASEGVAVRKTAAATRDVIQYLHGDMGSSVWRELLWRRRRSIGKGTLHSDS